MSSFPGSPRLLKGAIIGLDMFNPVSSIIVFQYNPHTLTRSISSSGSSAGGAQDETQRLSGPPTESITVEVEIDATDQLASGDDTAVSFGIHPQLAQLELLMHPKSAQIIANTAIIAAGGTEIIPPMAPLTLFIWGLKRIVPVQLSSLSITEEEFDRLLNPTRAKAQLNLRVLTYNDFRFTHPGFYMHLTHHVLKEAMAVAASIGAATQLPETVGSEHDVGASFGFKV